MTTCKTSRYFSLAILCAGSVIFSGSARADGITFNLTNATQTVSAGGTVTFSGKVQTTGNAATIYFNGDSYNVSSTAVLNDDPFFNFFPYSLDPNMTVTSPLFTVMIPLGSIGAFSGFFSLLGGANPDAQGILKTVAFEVDVLPSAPTTTTPEPSSLMLLGTGAFAAFGVARRKFRRS